LLYNILWQPTFITPHPYPFRQFRSSLEIQIRAYLHIQYFNRKNGFSFIDKGLKIAETKLGSGGFILTLIQNILNQDYTSVHQEKKDFVHHRLPRKMAPLPAHRENAGETNSSGGSILIFWRRRGKALVVVEVKKQGDDLDSAVSQGLSYVEWLFKYREQVKRLNCEVAAAYIDQGWIKDENISITGITPL
jgi:hypothetical protein